MSAELCWILAAYLTPFIEMILESAPGFTISGRVSALVKGIWVLRRLRLLRMTIPQTETVSSN